MAERPDDEAMPRADQDPEQFGLRVAWQSEEERLEAAEFLVATRAQHEARIRAKHDIDVRRGVLHDSAPGA